MKRNLFFAALATFFVFSSVGFSCGGDDVTHVFNEENERYALVAYYVSASVERVYVFTEGKTGAGFLITNVSFAYDASLQTPIATVTRNTAILAFRDVSQRIEYSLNAGVARGAE